MSWALSRRFGQGRAHKKLNRHYVQKCHLHTMSPKSETLCAKPLTPIIAASYHGCCLKKASILSIASCCMDGNTCEYTFAVMLKLLCPRSSCTTFIGTPILNKRVAALCLKSWKRI